MQQKMHLLNVNIIWEIYSNTLFNKLWHYQSDDVLHVVP